MRVSHEVLSTGNGNRHLYRLIVEVENTGSVRVIDAHVDIYFPKAFMDVESYGFEIHKDETETYKHLCPPDLQGGLLVGQRRMDNTIKYSVDGLRHWNDKLMELPVGVTVYADGMAPRQVKKRMRELQNF